MDLLDHLDALDVDTRVHSITPSMGIACGVSILKYDLRTEAGIDHRSHGGITCNGCIDAYGGILATLKRAATYDLWRSK